MNQDLKEIKDIITQQKQDGDYAYKAIEKIDAVIENAKNPGMKVRAAEPWELEQLAVACAVDKYKENHLLTEADVQEERDGLSQAGVSVIEEYTTDSPGYQGTVYVVVWSGGPEIVTTYIIEKGRTVRAEG